MAIPQITLALLLATIQPMFRSHPLAQEQSGLLVAVDGILRPLACSLFDETSFACPYGHYDLGSCPATTSDPSHKHSWFERGASPDLPAVPLHRQADRATQEDRGVSPLVASFPGDSTLCEIPLEADFDQPRLAIIGESNTPTAVSDNTAGYRASVESAYEPWYMEDYRNYYNDNVAANDNPKQTGTSDDVPCVKEAEQLTLDEHSDWHAFLNGPWPDEPLLDDDTVELGNGGGEMASDLLDKVQFGSRLTALLRLHRFRSIQEDEAAASDAHLTYEDLFDEIDEADGSLIWGPDDLETELTHPLVVKVGVTQGIRGIWTTWLSAMSPSVWTANAEHWLEKRGAPQAIDRATKWVAAQISAHDLPEEVIAPQVDARAENLGEKPLPSPRSPRFAERLDGTELRLLLGISSAVHHAAESLDQMASSLRGFAKKELASRAVEPHRRTE